MHNRGRWLLATWLAALLAGLPVWSQGQAQTTVQVDLGQPDISSFPEVVLTVGVRSLEAATGIPLDSTDFLVLENQTERPIASFETVQAGLDVHVVLNTIEAMDVRDAAGRSRWDLIRQALVGWWGSPGAIPFGRDVYSLTTRGGTLLARRPGAAELASLVDRLEPALALGNPALDLLLRSLQAEATAPADDGLAARALVFVTPLVDIPEDMNLANVVGAAQASSTAIYPVIVAPPDLLQTPAIQGFQTLADQTGGEMILFDPEQGLVPLIDLLEDRRLRYRLTYPSAVNTSGLHSVQVRLVTESFEASSPVRTFRAQVLPPEVTFVSPPSVLPLSPRNSGAAAATAVPDRVALNLLVTFPDGHPRPVVKSELLVDGALVTSAVGAPFDLLEWSIPADTPTGETVLEARVTDVLGLVGETEPHRLKIALPATKPPLSASPAMMAGFVALVAAAAVLIGLAPRMAARLNSGPALPTAGRRRLRRASLAPVAEGQAEAFLVPESSAGERLALTGSDVTVGGDASLASLVLFDPSVSGVHARLVRQADGRYIVRDQDTPGGTWVNHEAVSVQGTALKHFDRVHFGRVGFRFQFARPPASPEIIVSPPEEGSRPMRPMAKG